MVNVPLFERSTILLSCVSFLAIIILLETFLITPRYNQLKDDGNIINHAGIVRGSIQRVSKLAIASKEYDSHIRVVDDVIGNLQTASNRFELKGFSKEFIEHVVSLNDSWEILKHSIATYSESSDPENLRILLQNSEDTWNEANNMVLTAQLYSEEKTKFLKIFFFLLAFNLALVLFIGGLIYKYVRRELEFLSSFDSLTQVRNRFSFTRILTRELSLDNRHQLTTSLLVIDIDFFKDINDSHGHPAGDKVLQEIASLISKKIRKSDYLFRIGGEEFALLLPNTSIHSASCSAERIRTEIESHRFSNELNVTVSIGGSEYIRGEDDEDFMVRADSALYQAKAQGRNTVILDQ